MVTDTLKRVSIMIGTIGKSISGAIRTKEKILMSAKFAGIANMMANMNGATGNLAFMSTGKSAR